MGNKASTPLGVVDEGSQLSNDQMQEFLANTNFTPKEIQKLLLIYRKIGGYGISQTPKIEPEEFVQALKYSNPEIGFLMYKMIDSDGSGTIEFSEFVEGLNAFLPESPLDKKIELCFNVYDDDHGGTISKDEVTKIIMMSTKDNQFIQLDDAHLNLLVDELFEKYDSSLVGVTEDDDEEKRKGNMSLADFAKMVKASPGILDIFEFDTSMLPSPEEIMA
ncbi:Calcineurin subunit B [Tritrichomonas foetus]|uniref:Calcineurin subunit B n=1 Tax=Tritrichomonas foetus TaxID=1144522 RepID=A0A1J4KQH8_9EUKA|nr:Calcineurin subunit B [Tritrichomonas foetus]|eukprot:OHT12044.1 Calcineurin subunit B [Tritrichomonas foetus]